MAFLAIWPGDGVLFPFWELLLSEIGCLSMMLILLPIYIYNILTLIINST